MVKSLSFTNYDHNPKLCPITPVDPGITCILLVSCRKSKRTTLLLYFTLLLYYRFRKSGYIKPIDVTKCFFPYTGLMPHIFILLYLLYYITLQSDE